MKTSIITDLDLAKTFHSGQVFNWDFVEGAYLAPIGSTLYLLRQIDGGLAEVSLINGEWDDEALRCYFNLDRNYSEIYNEIAREHPELSAAVERARGIRLLKQDETEMLLTFILSQNNHIPRIKRSMYELKKLYGMELGTYQGQPYYGLPEYEVLSEMTERDFLELGAGYRAPYLVSAIRELPDLELSLSAPDLDAETIVNRLLKINGVGPKVAACIALFGYGSWEVFPIDTWVKKALKYYYGEAAEDKVFIKKKIRGFGPYKALVQQLMFYYMREGERDERRTKNQ